MGFFSWVIFGALAGWVANLAVGGPDRRRSGCLVNIAVGIVGAALGGLIYRGITGERETLGFDLPSFGVAVMGAVVLLLILRLISSAGSRTRRSRDRL
ncbi:GlsB/YeaQ/YmgE family stress response membrane protein [Amycolatopsis sp. NPDC059657]|uniref:GlsB/YeaQ/YmgE family stress response membrane protein n=1 Tax=Amycolatopsis sp. NPDC059657 TaxID=3346899 RepID=UPI00366CDCA4